MEDTRTQPMDRPRAYIQKLHWLFWTCCALSRGCGSSRICQSTGTTTGWGENMELPATAPCITGTCPQTRPITVFSRSCSTVRVYSVLTIWRSVFWYCSFPFACL